jgi:hypothetical protein
MPSLLINGEKAKDPEKFIDTFNNFFVTITENLNLHQAGKEDAITLLKESFPRKFPASKLIPITEAEIKCIIHSLKSKHSSSYDEITTKTLKTCPSLISPHLSFPGSLKTSILKPMLEKGVKSCMTNYRPISLLTTSTKVI